MHAGLGRIDMFLIEAHRSLRQYRQAQRLSSVVERQQCLDQSESLRGSLRLIRRNTPDQVIDCTRPTEQLGESIAVISGRPNKRRNIRKLIACVSHECDSLIPNLRMGRYVIAQLPGRHQCQLTHFAGNRVRSG
jgi:hypothetical protein